MEGGHRSSDYKGAAPGVIGAIKYRALDALFEETPALAAKLVNTFASAAIQGLQGKHSHFKSGVRSGVAAETFYCSKAAGKVWWYSNVFAHICRNADVFACTVVVYAVMCTQRRCAISK